MKMKIGELISNAESDYLFYSKQIVREEILKRLKESLILISTLKLHLMLGGIKLEDFKEYQLLVQGEGKEINYPKEKI